MQFVTISSADFKKNLIAILACIFLINCSARQSQMFTTPELALKALEDAVAERSIEKADILLGEEGGYILHTGDPVLDKQQGQKFVALFKEKHKLVPTEDGGYIVVIGKNDWPFPVPLAHGEKGWFFDSEAGREEILTRRIGENELNAIQIANTIYLAQRQYAGFDWDGDGKREYASRIISSPRSQDGLYWPAEEFGEYSPLGPTIAKAAEENYTINPGGEPKPYKGYLYKLYTSLPNDSNTANPLSRPGTYWLVSHPVRWGETGIMTFASNEQGWIYQNNLGEDFTPSEKKSFAIDDSWERIE